MKVTLLKKIRKRFSWYRRPQDGVLIVVDHDAESTLVLDDELLLDSDGNEFECGRQETERRKFLNYILRPFHPYYGYGFYYMVRRRGANSFSGLRK